MKKLRGQVGDHVWSRAHELASAIPAPIHFGRQLFGDQQLIADWIRRPKSSSRRMIKRNVSDDMTQDAK